MKTIKAELHYVWLLVLRLAIVFLMFSICRLFFYAYNLSSFENIEIGELTYIFVSALRFDTSSIFYANILLIAMHLFPFEIRASDWYKKIQKSIFLISNIIVLFFELGDIVYYPYAYRRMLGNDFEMGKDIQNLFPQFLIDFWYLVLIYFVLIYLCFYLYNKTEKTTIISQKLIPQVIILLAGLGITVTGMRGGFQLRPVMPINASDYVSNTLYMPLVSNTTLGLIHSWQQRRIFYKDYFDEETLNKIYNLDRKYDSDFFNKKNVVILVCESMGKEYTGYFSEGESHTPFLDSLLEKGMNFVNMYANGSRSTQGIASITGGLPALMTDPYIFSAYQNNNLIGLGDLLGKEGYTNAFFHGGEVGTMGFSHFMPIVGVNKYYGRAQYVQENNYPANQDYDGNWGVWDIPFYDYALKKINTFEQPFFTTLFSINVHHPFNTEPWFEELYPGTDKKIRAIKYADYNLKLFFEKASGEPWFKNTLFVLTADHSGPGNMPLYTNNEGRYKIPLLLYCPSDSNLIGVKHHVTEQIDIMPTVLHYLGYPKSFRAFGVSKLDTLNKQHYNYTFEKGIYQITGQEYVLQFDGNKSIALYHRLKDVYLQKSIIIEYPDVVDRLEKQLKAVIQVHNKSLIDNNLNK
jgi:phosphoglycerol transferase MdoB-like AlkP superfamily enzyme